MAALVAIPTVSACGAGDGSSPCSSASQRQLQASMSDVESRARVKSLRAIAPICDNSPDSSGLSAQRNYPSGSGVEDAIESALVHNGWVSTRARDGDAYVAQRKSGRFTAHVALTVQTDSESKENGSFLTAVYSLN